MRHLKVPEAAEYPAQTHPEKSKPRIPPPIERIERQGEENWREKSTGNTLGSTTERWRAAASRRKTGKRKDFPGKRWPWIPGKMEPTERHGGGGVGDRQVQDTQLEAPQTDGAPQQLSNRPPADTAAPRPTRSVSRSSRVSGNDPNPGRENAEKNDPTNLSGFQGEFCCSVP